MKSGKAQRIIKKDQVFSRIHVEDIVQVLCASIAAGTYGGVYNVCDNYPAPPQDVIGYAAELLGLPIPCLLYTSPSPRDLSTSRMPSSA